MNHAEIDLMHLRSLPCHRQEQKHTFLLHVCDHFTKYSWMIFLTGRHSIQVLTELEKLF